MNSRPTIWWVTLLLGMCLIAAAVVLTSLPISFYDIDGAQVRCGSVLAPIDADIVEPPGGKTAVNDDGYFATACGEDRQQRVLPATLLGGIGAVLIAGTMFMRQSRSRLDQ